MSDKYRSHTLFLIFRTHIVYVAPPTKLSYKNIYVRTSTIKRHRLHHHRSCEHDEKSMKQDEQILSLYRCHHRLSECLDKTVQSELLAILYYVDGLFLI